MILRLFLIFGLLSLAPGVLAAGGTCPSGAKYTNPANPTGALVTLSSLGITSCYYVAANGLDSNTGTDESHPWLHAPGMTSATGNSASAWSGTIPAGTGIIFRGGDTWHFGHNTGAYSGGTWGFNIPPYPHGTNGSPIYIGVDQGWYSGGAWARPIFDSDNSLCNGSTLGTMPDGATCSTSSGSGCFGTGAGFPTQTCYYVSACIYQSGSLNQIVDFDNGAYFTVDNIEMTGICNEQTGTPYEPDGYDTYVRYAQGGSSAGLVFENLYIHGASHPKFGAENGQVCTGVVCMNINAFKGSVNEGVGTGSIGDTVIFNVVDFSDSDPAGEQLNYGGLWNFAYNVVRYTTNSLPHPLHSFHDNLYEYFFENGHSNLIESTDEASVNVIYNNVFRHIEAAFTSNGGVFLWPGPQTGDTDYIFNNVMYDVGSGEYFNMGGTGGTTNPGNYTFFNNTFQSNVGQGLYGCVTSSPIGTVLNTNNHAIDDSNPGTCTAMTIVNQLWQSNTAGGSAPSYSDANSSPHFDQYTSSQTYGYSPTASTNSTVGVGTNETSGYCATLLASSDPLIQAAGTACKSDTTYGIVYNASTHTVSVPNRAVNARSASGAWDIGAYQFGQSVPAPATAMFAGILQASGTQKGTGQ